MVGHKLGEFVPTRTFPTVTVVTTRQQALSNRGRIRTWLKKLHQQSNCSDGSDSGTEGASVLDLIRGKSVAEALGILKFTPTAGAEIVEKVLNSAIANAENNFVWMLKDLYVSENVC